MATAFAVFAASAAWAIDPDDCRGAAGDLKDAAAQLEDAAEELGSAQVRDRSRHESAVRSEASNALAAFNRTKSACGAAVPAVPPEAVLRIIKLHLVSKYAGPDYASRLAQAESGLIELAKIHSRIRPGDFGMTLAVAEAIFIGSSR